MRRVLRTPVLDADGSAPWETDFGTAPSVEEIEQAAYRRGLEHGRVKASEQFLAVAQAVQTAVAEQRSALRAEFDSQQRRLVETALELAEYVIGHAQHDGGAALRRRLELALATIDDRELNVAVHPDDVDAVEQMEIPAITVVADPSLHPGEARIVGEWSRTDLTFAAAIAAVRRAADNA